MTRIVICGGPRTGKTTLAWQMFGSGGLSYNAAQRSPHQATVHFKGGTAVLRHTDDLIESHDWSAASAEVAAWLDAPGPWIIEGVAMARALRKWREACPGEPPPVDRVIRLTAPREALSKGQAAMAKGEQTVWAEIEEWLLDAGVPVSLRAELSCTTPGYNGIAKLE